LNGSVALRRFQLPGIQDLSKEQEEALARTKEGRHLVIGGPGTGKSVLALLRARRHQRDGDDYLFLVFNHLLQRASRQLFPDDLRSATWDGWFRRLFRERVGRPIPTSNPGPDGYRPIDWEAVGDLIEDRVLQASAPPRYLIIDEGQDMPPQFYRSLSELGFENLFVVADPNQQIVLDRHSDRCALKIELGIDCSEVIELRENYRNSYPTARLARELYPDNPGSPPLELPSPTRTARTPILFRYTEPQFPRLITRMLQIVDRNPRRLLGIIAPNNTVRQQYYEALCRAETRLDNGRPPIATYRTGLEADLSFDRGGIVVINAQSCKGLEFDWVFVADIDAHRFRADDPLPTKALFYVMVARAIDRVILLQRAGRHCPVEPILPQDEDILERRS
jgi:DNA helicase II / ATP-dependent DNA helicase PcrA